MINIAILENPTQNTDNSQQDLENYESQSLDVALMLPTEAIASLVALVTQHLWHRYVVHKYSGAIRDGKARGAQRLDDDPK
jgi:hypothetical protein